ncbi:MAG: hypothetical protein PW788_12385 [Micavibrio sp.]|nr:hypothetical protein [Micavibrio sp.]
MENVESPAVKTSGTASQKGWLCMALVAVFYLIFMKLLHGGLPVDRPLEELFFTRPCTVADAHACWLINKNNHLATFFAHTLPATIFTAVGVAGLLVFIGSFFVQRLRRWRNVGFAFALGIGGVAGIVSIAKNFTGHYCPSQLGFYNGPVVEPYSGKIDPLCFPAGHPSPGFGLLVLYFADIPLFWRRVGLYGGIVCGSGLGIIQMMRGEHFLSHILATCITALFVGACLSFINRFIECRKNAPAGR